MSSDYDWYFGTYGYELPIKEPEALKPNPCSQGIHRFADTGLLKSWCRDCGEEGEFDRKTGRYVVVATNKKGVNS